MSGCKILYQKRRHLDIGILLKQQTMPQTQTDIYIKIRITVVKVSGLKNRITTRPRHFRANFAAVETAFFAVHADNLKPLLRQNGFKLVGILLHASL